MTVRHGYRRHREGRVRYEPSNPLARLFRPSCSACASPVQWLPIGLAVDVLGVERMNGLLEQMDGLPLDGPESFDVWKCTSCDQCGVLSGLDSGSL